MTEEEIKDLRLMLEMISKDLARLGDDVRQLSECFRPLQLAKKEVNNEAALEYKR